MAPVQPIANFMDIQQTTSISSEHEEHEKPKELEQPMIRVKKRKKTIIKIVAPVICLLLIAGLVYYYKGLFIAATVNGTPITRISVLQELERVSGKAALDSLITEKLINDEAVVKGSMVTAEEIAAEISKIESQVTVQGKTLDEALKEQGMTRTELTQRIRVQKNLEKLLADKIKISETEVDQYIKDNAIKIPAGQETDYRTQIAAQLEQQKLSTEADSFIASLRSKARIKYFVSY